MPSKLGKRKSTEVIFEDEPSKKASRSTPRISNTTPKQSTSAAAGRKQNTLTQMRWIPSPHIDDENVDLEYDHGPMQPTRRSSRGKRSKLIQSETITQMDFLLSPALPEEELTELEEDGMANTPSAPPLRKKERKATREEPLVCAVQTRSAKRSATKQSETVIENDRLLRQISVEETPIAVAETPLRASHTRRTEVPSSQSPPDSPLSTQRGRSGRAFSRSPLKERPLNVPSPRRPVGKGVLFPRKLVVADSTGSDHEDSQTPTQPPPTSTLSQYCYMPPAVRIRSDSQLTDSKGLIRSDEEEVDQTRNSADLLTNSQIKPETEEYDGGEANDVSEAEQLPNYSRSQVIYATTVPSPERVHRETISAVADAIIPTTTEVRDFGFSAVNDTTNVEDALNDKGPGSLHRASSELSIPDFEDNASQQPSHREPDLSESDVDNIPSTPEAPPASTPKAAATQSQVHIQQLHSPVLALETESQFENAWRTLSPPTCPSPEMIPSSQPSTSDRYLHRQASPPPIKPFINPSLPRQHRPLLSQATTTDDTQPLPSQPTGLYPIRSSSPKLLPKPSSQEPPSPSPSPSQATTTDSTQLQQRSPLPRHINRTTSPQQLSSSPPPPSLPPLSSSSPMDTRNDKDANAWMAYAGGWDGQRRTDSQLLPHSLMNDSVPGPPGWGTQESLSLDEDETCE